ncbi:hypothetical protein AWB80_08287 [Caballeronia pedi]|uniref:Uncharacterized protein n=1 Tax=Caballeronia pedi TaxID=1777141 RepID=A0A158E5H6_9BURK|nr:hypothetical protein [Caballeronia pedi]SAL02141.1 hypothetical protein AWB80_08287 [Caballeronia pedi]
MAKRAQVVKRQELNGIFIVDLKVLQLSNDQLEVIGIALQETVQAELAKIDDTEGLKGGPLGGGIAGYVAAMD